MRISLEAKYLIGGSALLAAVPMLEVARENVSFLIWYDFWITLLVLVGIETLLISILTLLFPNRLSIAAAVTLAIWLSAYHEDLVGPFQGSAANGLGSSGLLVFPLGLLVAVTLMPRDLVARAIGAFGLALFALAVVQLFLAKDFTRFLQPAIDPTTMIDRNPLPKLAKANGRLPDIIYIVPDRYGSSGVQDRAFDHANSAFIGALRQRGFAVAEDARANYLKTHYSLASSMNMQYLEPLLQSLNGKTSRAQPLYSLIQDNLVAARLKQMGYRYIHVPTWWDGTKPSAHADLIVNFWPESFGGEFGLAILRRSAFYLMVVSSIYPIDPCDAFKQQLAYLEDVGGDDRPTFVFAHILAPHSPILVDGEGGCIEPLDYPARPPGITWEGYQGGYGGVVDYINKRFLEIFDRQKANNPNPLIFVLQADEGPFPKELRERLAGRGAIGDGTGGSDFDWRKASDAQLATKFGILNALYLGDPDGTQPLEDVPNTLTPVNNWRVIFSRLEGRTYPLQPDRHFIFPTEKEPYNSIDITERLNDIPR